MCAPGRTALARAAARSRRRRACRRLRQATWPRPGRLDRQRLAVRGRARSRSRAPMIVEPVGRPRRGVELGDEGVVELAGREVSGTPRTGSGSRTTGSWRRSGTLNGICEHGHVARRVAAVGSRASVCRRRRSRRRRPSGRAGRPGSRRRSRARRRSGRRAGTARRSLPTPRVPGLGGIVRERREPPSSLAGGRRSAADRASGSREVTRSPPSRGDQLRPPRPAREHCRRLPLIPKPL